MPAQPLTHFVRFAPNGPSQKLIEDARLQTKTWLRWLARLPPCFIVLKALFEQVFIT